MIDNPTKYLLGRPSLLDIDGLELLIELALDMRCTWYHAADNLWQQLEPDLWEQSHNPWAVLQTASYDRIKQVLSDPKLRKQLDRHLKTHHQLKHRPAWFQQQHADSPLRHIAYFSMEFMLSEALPIYSGGLGNVAGDQLKAASDLGVPVIGIGLLYQRGYFRQVIDNEGRQLAFYPYNDPGQLPIQPVRQKNGEWLRLKVQLPGYNVWLRCWQVHVGRATLYLLDSNDPANFPTHQGITSELYGGGTELRLQQEMLLGIGGWRLLTELGIEPEVCHLNEGHAAFAVLERARCYQKKHDLPFAAALNVTRAGNLFTTHTAVAAAFDLFPPQMIKQYLGHYAEAGLKISIQELLALGRLNPNDDNEPFNMAYLAIRGSGAINGVSQLHGRVSREIFQSLFPRWPTAEIPIQHVTNGVHMPSWDSPIADQVWTDSCGKDRWLNASDALSTEIHCLCDAKLWEFRSIGRQSLINYARKRLARQLAASGASLDDVEQAKTLLDPNILTLGFARRFATYKRPNLLLHDPERLLRILSNPERPVQLIIAGKAHPADYPGQAMIQQWIKFIRQPHVRPHIIFLSDYDMQMTERLVEGVDVWLNTPRRPWEACGTSGMKVLVNGGLNLSELDGWWAEAYNPEVGWALGDGQEHDHDPAWDAKEADDLYTLLEQEIAPQFYHRDSNGIPKQWVNRIRESMSQLTPVYSASRAVRQYTEHYYLPAAQSYQARTKAQPNLGQDIYEWKNQLQKNWTHLRFGEYLTTTQNDRHIIDLQVYVDDIDANAIQVELYADGLNDTPPERHIFQHQKQLVGAINAYDYHIEIPATRPLSDYTPRIIPRHDIAQVPLEANFILWHH
ncbi:alpha-glucan family phosphorylase [methane-oxidizing endosymbiont of Gigantopelta aegis]|uniref:alpha-glucan family phosphorylase n=1 Tax=methane-oxidizing endosymbiont of Gigantopelta aegis TaxID=2794938 RepID=UPI0018DCFFC2|nr:alpha-glucan family phosphorylase [methane-oxidizing endosymbiont of Gigantopelta aegis]